MSNRLKRANIHAIIGLLEQEWPYRPHSAGAWSGPRYRGAIRPAAARSVKTRHCGPRVRKVFGGFDFHLCREAGRKLGRILLTTYLFFVKKVSQKTFKSKILPNNAPVAQSDRTTAF